MGRPVERLTLDNLALLPGPCSTCTFWELDPVRRQQVAGHEAEEKAAWLSTMLRDWGSVGRVVRVDDQVAGHLLCCNADPNATRVMGEAIRAFLEELSAQRMTAK